LMEPGLAAWPNQVVSAPCQRCGKQYDLPEPRDFATRADFDEAVDEMKEWATARCDCGVRLADTREGPDNE